METCRGEIVGIAGVDGNDNANSPRRLWACDTTPLGTISILGTDPKGTKAVRHRGVGYIPEDRQTTGVIAAFSVTENLLLNVTHLENLTQWNILNQKKKRETAESLIADYDIRPPNPDIPVSALSGGITENCPRPRNLTSPRPSYCCQSHTRFRCQRGSLCTREFVGTTRPKENLFC